MYSVSPRVISSVIRFVVKFAVDIMDNSNLNNLLLNLGERQFWIKPWGHPERSPDEEEQIFNSPTMTIGFARQPNAVQVGDILLVHRIKVSMLMFVAEVISSPHQATDEEIRKNPLLERWKWSVEAQNLTPDFGAHWRNFSLKTFALADEFKKSNPNEQFTLGSINFGNDKVRVPENFGKFVVQEIMRLEK